MRENLRNTLKANSNSVKHSSLPLPPPYKGEKETAHIILWVEEIDDYFEGTETTEAEKSRFVVRLLKEEAENWYFTYYRHMGAPVPPWNEFKQTLIESFSNLAEGSIIRQFTTLKRKGSVA